MSKEKAAPVKGAARESLLGCDEPGYRRHLMARGECDPQQPGGQAHRAVIPRPGVNDSWFAVDDPGFAVDDSGLVVDDNPWLTVGNTEMPFAMVQVLRHTLHVVDAAVERTQQVVHMPGVAMNMPPEPALLCTIDNGMQMVCQVVELLQISHDMAQ